VRNRRKKTINDDFDEKYQYFHLGHLETSQQGKEIEQKLINNAILAEKSITISGCWSFRWKRGKYDEKTLNSIFIVSDFPGLKYIQKEWQFLPKNGAKQRKRRNNRVNGR